MNLGPEKTISGPGKALPAPKLYALTMVPCAHMRAVHHGNVMRTVPNIVTNIAALYYSCIADFLNDPIFSTQDMRYLCVFKKPTALHILG